MGSLERMSRPFYLIDPDIWHVASYLDRHANSRSAWNRIAGGAPRSTSVPFRRAPLRQPGGGDDADPAHLSAGTRPKPRFAGPGQCPSVAALDSVSRIPRSPPADAGRLQCRAGNRLLADTTPTPLPRPSPRCPGHEALFAPFACCAASGAPLLNEGLFLKRRSANG
jgi:hypothetical protein